MSERIYLSRRNLQTLLNKLDRFDQGQDTQCAIIKYANPLDPYCNTVDEVMIIAVPDDKFYTQRTPGAMHLLGEP